MSFFKRSQKGGDDRADEDAAVLLPGVDARNAVDREIVKFLREQHLPGVDADDDASVVLEVEQARLLLIASAGIIAFEVTQLLAIKRAVCVTPLYYSLGFLGICLAGAWLGLVWAERLRRFRVDRRYKIFHSQVKAYQNLTPADKVDPYAKHAVWSEQLGEEGRRRKRFRFFRYAVAAFAAAGIVAGVLSAIGTVDTTRCISHLITPQADPK